MKLIFLGAPGVGKGTVAKIVSQRYNIPHISTGDMIRAEIAQQTPFGKKVEEGIKNGKFISDDEAIELITKCSKQKDCKNGFVLDGFPRNIVQAEALQDIEKIDAVVNLYVSKKEIIKRLLGRRYCPKCKRDYNLVTSQSLRPKHDEVCDICNIKLAKRPDDNKETILERLKIYENETKPLIDFYKNKGLLKEIDGSGELEEVADRVLNVL